MFIDLWCILKIQQTSPTFVFILSKKDQFLFQFMLITYAVTNKPTIENLAEFSIILDTGQATNKSRLLLIKKKSRLYRSKKCLKLAK